MNPIYYDTETTGVKTDKDRIIEIAGYNPLTDESFCSFVNPQMPIPKESIEICNITDEMVQDAPTFDIVAKQFFEFCGPNAYLIAHNNESFDKKILYHECKRVGVELPEFTYIDTLKWARKYRPDLPRHSLQYIREIYDIPENNAHRALDDVMVLHEIFSQMIDDLPMKVVHELLSQKEPAIKSMPFGKHRGIPIEKVPSSYLKWLGKSGALDKPENEKLKQALEELNLITT